MRKGPAVAIAIASAWLSIASPAAAYQTNGVTVTDFATGFAASAGGVGPLGIALDQSNRLFAVDTQDAFLYRFDGPGAASPSTRLGSAPLGGDPAGLAFDASGHLYAARYGAHEVVEVNPNTGAVVRTVASGLACPQGLAADPISGGIFVTLGCDAKIVRIADPASSAPHVEPFASGVKADGIAAAPDGTVYVATSGEIDRITGTGSATPGQRSVVTQVSAPDGVAVGAGASAQAASVGAAAAGGAASGQAAFILVNRTNGKITRVDLTGSSPTSTDVVTGGTRGDFAAAGRDGCFYATQTSTILKMTNLDGSCTNLGGPTAGGLAPTTPLLSGSTNPLGLPASKGCVDSRKFTFKLHHGPGALVVGVTAFVNGKRVLHKSGKDIKRLTLRRLPQKKFRVRIASLHSNGAMLVSTRTYRGCKKSRPHTRAHHGTRH